ncbi:hypothetical protein H6G97_48660 [Nostoc flagelliforme FACHB-838]|uniref:Lipoprotein n=1 Tax=Nostoc flagelliforme FACHB-838 TaxID=2692904 RepID=A0ABR8E528_9NOSO|nr:hypothetical protein [Nostoc flagelliforme]MBD2536706.1 hypothetical protein [Nostoc flagelliforme FACHB-838]
MKNKYKVGILVCVLLVFTSSCTSKETTYIGTDKGYDVEPADVKDYPCVFYYRHTVYDRFINDNAGKFIMKLDNETSQYEKKQMIVL